VEKFCTVIPFPDPKDFKNAPSPTVDSTKIPVVPLL